MRFDLGTFTQPSFMFLVGLGAVISILFVALRHRTIYQTPSMINLLDVGIVTWVAGVFGAKAGYILINGGTWSTGGLSWHTGLILGMVTLYALSKWRKADQAFLWDSVAWCVPLIMGMAWWGCMGASCGFGQEIDTLADYPAVMVWEGRDLTQTLAPRFATQQLGLIGAVIAWLVLSVVAYKKWLIGRWFGLMLVMIGLIMFGLGFLRGDPAVMVGGLRADQVLDGLIILLGALMCLTRPIESPPVQQSIT